MNLEQLLEFLRGRQQNMINRPPPPPPPPQKPMSEMDAIRMQQQTQDSDAMRRRMMDLGQRRQYQSGAGRGLGQSGLEMLQGGPQSEMDGMRMQQQMQQPLRPQMQPQMQPQMPNMPQMQEQMQQQMGRLNDQDLQKLHQQMQQQSAPSVNPEGIAGSLLGRPPMSEMQRRMMNQRMMAPRFGASFGVQR